MLGDHDDGSGDSDDGNEDGDDSDSDDGDGGDDNDDSRRNLQRLPFTQCCIQLVTKNWESTY